MAGRLRNKIVSIVMVIGIVLLSGCGKEPESGNGHEMVENSPEQGVDQNTQIGAEMDDTGQEIWNTQGGNTIYGKAYIPEGGETEEDAVETDQICIKVGESTLTAILEDNEAAEALKGLLAGGPLAISASNYGGFEKVCSLGTELPRNDSQTATHAGDICLYNGNQIVIFYGSNSWAYTRLGKISDVDAEELEKVLSGEETEITLSLGASH